MEKINTPLMTAIEKTRIELNKAETRRKNFKDKGRQELSENCSDLINNLEDQIKMLESLLPTEREMIERAFISGSANTVKERYSDKKLHLNPKFQDDKDYFTQTFKSYE